MHFPLQKALSLLFLASPGLLTPVQQSPLLLSCHSEVGTSSENNLHTAVHFGYQGPGVYHIIGVSDHFQLSLGDVGSGDGAPVVVWKANETQSQLWFVSDVGDGQVTIANNGTGVLLTAGSSRAATYTQFGSPANLRTHWQYSNYSTPSNALRLANAKFPGEILAVYNQITQVNGTKVYVWPSVGQNQNEAWYFHYMGPS